MSRRKDPDAAFSALKDAERGDASSHGIAPAGSGLARNVDIEFHGGLIVGIGLLTEGTLLATKHANVLACFPTGFAALTFLIIFLTYTYRFYSNRHDSGRSFYLVAMLVICFMLIVFAITGCVILIMHASGSIPE